MYLEKASYLMTFYKGCCIHFVRCHEMFVKPLDPFFVQANAFIHSQSCEIHLRGVRFFYGAVQRVLEKK